MPPYLELNNSQVDHFVQHGWIKLEQCFTRDQAAEITANVWTRLGVSPTDKSTWTSERIHMPHHRTFDVATFAPKAWNAICDLVGGESRVSPTDRTWKDSLIVNLGTPEGEGKDVHPHKLYIWHVDGDFFVHYLDSPEQGLLVIPLFSDIAPGGGGTYICPEAIPKVARYLYEHPEGVSPRMAPRAEGSEWKAERNLNWFNALAKSCDHFVEATGSVGDVYLLHPLMLHTASNNKLRVPRIITNPPVSLKDPFQFDRKDRDDFSVVERTTLRALGKESLPGWQITAARERIVPERVRIQQRMKEEEMQRMKAESMGVRVEATEVGT